MGGNSARQDGITNGDCQGAIASRVTVHDNAFALFAQVGDSTRGLVQDEVQMGVGTWLVDEPDLDVIGRLDGGEVAAAEAAQGYHRVRGNSGTIGAGDIPQKHTGVEGVRYQRTPGDVRALHVACGRPSAVVVAPLLRGKDPEPHKVTTAGAGADEHGALPRERDR